MAVAKDSRKTGVRILLGAVVLVLGGSMLLYLVPQTPGTGEASSPDIVAKVGSETVSTAEVRQQLAENEQRNQVPKQLVALCARQILSQLIFQKEMEYEAKRLGIRVSDQERADRIRQFLPTAYNGDTFVGMDRYAAEVQARFQLTVPVFEELIRQGLLQDKFRKLVTDGVSVGPSELQDEFKYRNEKVKLDYAFIKPEDLEAKITPDEAEIKAAYEKNRSRYHVPEFEKTAFGLDKGKLSDLVKTQYGFHIIKVLDKETAHTKPFEEVKDSIKTPLLLAKADRLASDEADQLSATIRRSNKVSLDDLAKQFHLSLGETRPVTATDPILELGNSKQAKDPIFRLPQHERSVPIRTAAA